MKTADADLHFMTDAGETVSIVLPDIAMQSTFSRMSVDERI